MNVEIKKEDNYTVVALCGDLDGTTSNDVYQNIMPVLDGSANIVFEMKDCSYVSSAGLRVLLMSAKQLKKNSGQGVFVNLSSEVEEVMQMTGFDNIFKAYDSIDEALKDLGKE